MQATNLHFIAVGTPPGEDGSADLTHVLQVAHDLGRLIQSDCIIIDKSTVPVGTAERVRARGAWWEFSNHRRILLAASSRVIASRLEGFR